MITKKLLCSSLVRDIASKISILMFSFWLHHYCIFIYCVIVLHCDEYDTNVENGIIICFKILAKQKQQTDVEIRERDKLKDIKAYKTTPGGNS